MIRSLIQKSAIAGLLLTSVVPAHAQSAPNPDRAAVQELIVRMGEGIQAGSFAAVDSLFPARGLHILTDTLTLHGWAEYRDQHLKPEVARFSDLSFRHTAVEAVVRGDVAWVAFRQLINGTPSGDAPAVNGRATAVLERREGRWLIVHLHVSR